MSAANVAFTKDILLDQESFQTAAARFDALAEDMNTLRRDVETLLNELERGFDTPAGRKFIHSCRNSLLRPMEDQETVIRHVSDNLRGAREQYEPVFAEYQALNRAIQTI